jgi:uncharacterized protein YqiB (DUF1249 family)
MLRHKRNIDDYDGMLEDLKNHYNQFSKQELIDYIMELVHEDQDHNDFLEDWVNFCYGEVIDNEI